MQMTIPEKTLVAISSNSELEELWFLAVNMRDSDLLVIGQFPQLKRLKLFDSNIRQLDSVFALKTLAELDLRYNRIGAANWEGLSALTKLESLRLGSCDITDKAIAHIVKLRNLRSLDISNNARISEPSVRKLLALPLIRELDLSQLKLSAECIEDICRIPSLRKINLVYTHVSEEVIKAIKKRRPDLDIRH
jgi:Leucine-rich repeat (LRR) protein